MVAADIPANDSTVTVSQSGTDVVVAWTEPDYNGLAINYYTIYLYNASSGTYAEQATV